MEESFYSVVHYSFYILESNYIEFIRTIDSYIKAANSDEVLFDGEKRINLSIDGGREIARLIHNYAASWLSLVDHTRIVYSRLKVHNLPEIQDFVNEYELRLEEYLKDSFENIFVKDLRRYVQHKKIPVPSLYFKMKQIGKSESGKPLFAIGYSFEFNSRDIEDFNWHKKTKEYINSNRSVPIAQIIDKHFSIMKVFYLWIQFRDHQLRPYTTKEVTDITFED